MTSLLSRFACPLLATLGLAVLSAPAQAIDTPFTSRFAQTVRGNVSPVGNTLMTCPASAACAAAQSGTASGNALNNNSYAMSRVDIDGDASTFDSSSATVSLPSGSTVVWAGLYWAADTTAGSGGSAAPTAASRDTVKLKVPGGSYQTISASAADVLTSTSQPSRYRAFRDVTSLVPTSASGDYTVANVQAGTGADRFAGWALFVAYRDDSQALRRLNVYDGLGTVDDSHAFTTSIAPFHTPVAGPVTTKIGLLSFEGDAGLATESTKFNGQALTDALNPANNAMNSTIESAGTRLTAKSPDYVNQLGMDLDSFANAGALANDQTSASLAFTSTNEYFMPSAFFLVSDEGPPVSTGGGPAVGGPAQDGGTLSADPGSFNGTGPLTYSYQWQRCDANSANCADIPGATQSTYVPGAADVGHTIRVIVIAVNDAGSSPPVISAPTAVTEPSAGSTTTGPEPSVPTSAPAGAAPSHPTGTPRGNPGSDVLGEMARGLLGETNCQQLVGGARYRRVALARIGTVRVRAYTSGPALKSSPVQLTTQVTGGRARSVRYVLDGRAIGAGRGSRHAASLTPSQLGKVGTHKLKTAVRGVRGATKTVSLTLRTVPCQTLFTAQRWRTAAGAGLRLRVDSRTALARLSFSAPTALLPRRMAKKRPLGFIRLYVKGSTKPRRFSLSLPRRGSSPRLLGPAGTPTVSMGRAGLKITGLPALTAVAELTLYRVTKLDHATSQRMYTLTAKVARAGAKVETFRAKPTPH